MDVNLDALIDLLVSHQGSLSILLNQGSGRFRTLTELPVDHYTLGDMNRDGRPDIVCPYDELAQPEKKVLFY